MTMTQQDGLHLVLYRNKEDLILRIRTQRLPKSAEQEHRHRQTMQEPTRRAGYDRERRRTRRDSLLCKKLRVTRQRSWL